MNSQEFLYNSFQIYAVTIKTSMTEYHHLMTHNIRLTIYSKTAVYDGNGYGKSGHLSFVTSLKH